MTTGSTKENLQSTELAGQYLTFFLGDEEYALQILHVQEIIRVMRATPMPRTPGHVLGVINLRGKVIPIFDLRRRFDLPQVEPGGKTCIIVVHVHGKATGVVVDRVSEVVEIGSEEVDSLATLGANVRTEFLLGIANCADGLKILLDLESVVPSPDLDAMSA